jgi:uncharacterized membrane protein YccC
MLTWLRVDQKEVLHSIRTAVAAVGSLLIARFCGLPESYWAAFKRVINFGEVEEPSSSRSRSPSTARRAATFAILMAIL